MPDLRKFLFTTDFPIDQVVYLDDSKSYTVAGNDSKYFTFAHGLPFTPLTIGYFGIASSPGTFFQCGSVNPNLLVISGRPYFVVITADAMNIRVFADNYSSTAQTFNLFVVGLEPSNSTANLAATADLSNRFVFNTGFNYPKQLMRDRVPLPVSRQITVYHGLKYLPQVMVWVNQFSFAPDGSYAMGLENTGSCDNGQDPPNNYQGVLVDSSSVIISEPTGPDVGSPVEYIIYGDEI
jgi:hypothetical protein